MDASERVETDLSHNLHHNNMFTFADALCDGGKNTTNSRNTDPPPVNIHHSPTANHIALDRAYVFRQIHNCFYMINSTIILQCTFVYQCVLFVKNMYSIHSHEYDYRS